MRQREELRFNIGTIRTAERTDGQAQVKLSLLPNVSLKFDHCLDNYQSWFIFKE
jgi:hypothetical protein